jgi:hypothetical protein
VAAQAFVYLDRCRLQFTRVSDRVAWRDQTLGCLDKALETATMSQDHSLAVELIETALNQGIYASATPLSTHHPQPLALLNLQNATDQAEPLLAPALALSSAAGGIQLVAGARLPMAPPPLLRLPDGTIALHYIHARSSHRYNYALENAALQTW